MDVIIRSPSLLAELEARGWPDRDPGSVAMRDLARFYRLLADELRAVPLREAEGVLIHVALSQARAARERGEDAPTSLPDAVEWANRRNGLAEPNRVNVTDLISRLRALPPVRALAVLDAFRRLRPLLSAHGGRSMLELMQAVGFEVSR